MGKSRTTIQAKQYVNSLIDAYTIFNIPAHEIDGFNGFELGAYGDALRELNEADYNKAVKQMNIAMVEAGIWEPEVLEEKEIDWEEVYRIDEEEYQAELAEEAAKAAATAESNKQ